MELINKEQVSNITAYKETEGFKIHGDTFWKCTYYGEEYFKLLWLFPIKTLDAGFYRNGKKDSWSKMDDNFFNEKHHCTLLGSAYTKCHIDIFTAGKKIHTEFFKTYEELEQHLKENYSNVNVRYE